MITSSEEKQCCANRWVGNNLDEIQICNAFVKEQVNNEQQQTSQVLHKPRLSHHRGPCRLQVSETALHTSLEGMEHNRTR